MEVSAYEDILHLFGEVIFEIARPREFFSTPEGQTQLEKVVTTVRRAFGREEMDYQDIYNHVTAPEKVYLLEGKETVFAMASYSRAFLSGIPSMIVEGIAVDPSMQGRGVFREMTDCACTDTAVICLRTQNPRMYRALETYCSYVYPGRTEMPPAVIEIRNAFARHLNCEIDSQGIIRRYYGGLFYREEPVHADISPLFKERLSLDLLKGDAVLVVGVV